MTSEPTAPPVSVVIAVLTYRRPEDIERALAELTEQTAKSSDTAHILVIDNDPDGGAAAQVGAWADRGVRYVHEPEPGIAAARNRALAESDDDRLLIFFDDDERPSEHWLDLMLAQWRATGAEAVVGSVVSEFADQLEPWVEAGRFFDRRRLRTGTVVDAAATNNLLLDMDFVRAHGLRFDARYGLSGGSDTLFTRQIVERGGTMVWCDEATVIDHVPVNRLSREWVLQRAYRSGNSWSRTSLELAGSGGRLALRLKLLAQGAVRYVGGAARAAVGTVTRSLTHRAKGRRTMSRGAGMISGALGSTYVEYKRATA